LDFGRNQIRIWKRDDKNIYANWTRYAVGI
jgi:hypothetical protein